MTTDRIAELTSIIQRDPSAGENWLELGEELYRAERFNEAGQVLGNAAQLIPQNPMVSAYRGLVAQASGDPDSAIVYYSHAVRLSPNDRGTRHNLATALREADRASDALAETDRAIAAGSSAAETLTLRGHLLAELGRIDEALTQYQAVIARHPSHIDAQETFARLLPQIGRVDEALDGYRDALIQSPNSVELWHSAIRIAHEHKNVSAMLEFIDRAERQLGMRPEFEAALASARSLSGEHGKAREILTALVKVYPRDHGLRTSLSHNLLCLHDPKAAETQAIAATQLGPMDRTGWAHLTTIWRLLDDPREAWLADYDRFVTEIDVALPDALQDALDQQHNMHHQPAEQSLRGGTQTRGYLFGKRLPAIQQLGQAILDALKGPLDALPRGENHPFLSRNTGAIAFSGAWSIKLRNEGFHINHIHPQGWLSSALYIALPDAIDEGHGALAFGVPDAAFGLDLAPRRVVVPAVGKLVIFPSYFWHGTVPFESEQPRMTVAFDALPIG